MGKKMMLTVCLLAIFPMMTFGQQMVTGKEKRNEMRARPNLLAKVVGKIEPGEKCPVLKVGEDRKWYYVENKDKKKGWVYEKYVTVEGVAESVAKELSPEESEVKTLFDKAQKFNAEKRYEECLELLNQVILKDPFNKYEYTTRARFGKGICYMGLKESEKSSIAFLDFIKKFPNNQRIPEAYYFTILNYYEIGLEKKGEEKVLILVKDYPDSDWTKKTMDFVVGEYLLKTKKNFDKAIEILDHYITKNPNGSFINSLKFQCANILKARGSFRRAETLFREIALAIPGTPLGFQAEDNVVDVFMVVRDYDAAMTYLNSLKSNNASRIAVILSNKAQISYVRGDIEEALKQYQNLVDNYATSSVVDNALKSLGNIYFSRYSNYDKAIGYYKRILDEYNGSDATADAIYGLANSYYLKGEPTTALTYFKQLKEKYPEKAKQLIVDVEIKNIETNLEDDPAPFMTYIQGLNLEKKNEIAAARDKYLKIVNEYPKAKIYVEALYKVAITYISEKNLTAAVPYLKKIAEDYPDTPFGKDAQKKLTQITEILNKPEPK